MTLQSKNCGEKTNDDNDFKEERLSKQLIGTILRKVKVFPSIKTKK